MWKKNVETFIGCESEYQDADIVLFGAPFDSTTSYRPGTRFASKAIRGESFGIETYSPYQDRDLCDLKVFDGGDLELPFGDCDRALAQIQACVCGILEDGKLPVMMGGEHLVTLGAVRAAAERYPQLHIIQFDAHADLRDSYLDVALSHACVMRRCHEIIGDGIGTESEAFLVAFGVFALNADAIFALMRECYRNIKSVFFVCGHIEFFSESGRWGVFDMSAVEPCYRCLMHAARGEKVVAAEGADMYSALLFGPDDLREHIVSPKFASSDKVCHLILSFTKNFINL